MCKRFEDDLNEDIKLLVVTLKLKEFVVLVDRAYKAEELSKEKRQTETEARDLSKRLMGKSYQSASKKLKKYHDHSITSTDTLVETEKSEKESMQTLRPSNTAIRGRPSCNLGNVSGSCDVKKDSTIRSDAQTPARAYAIRTHEDASTPDVITGTFSLIGTDVTALINLGSTHSYVCMKLVSSKNLPVELTEFMVKVSNPLDQLSIVISAMSVQKYMRKGCNAYLAYVLDTKVSESKLELMPAICEYPDVFPKELPRLPLIREVEFAIELVPRTTPILIAPYKMAPTDLKV
ncbi:uncharacterized protein LOC128041729 [Gossypium raimondii]|uniref:uncharacterized protein LOC128041729 n=1 Tax=Gossypium raimondii TaxID=29730 RepID=UPI002279F9EF|nr:uncharacterized protein LOC128041729 [Gossypium raimondii]